MPTSLVAAHVRPASAASATILTALLYYTATHRKYITAGAFRSLNPWKYLKPASYSTNHLTDIEEACSLKSEAIPLSEPVSGTYVFLYEMKLEQTLKLYKC